MWLLGAAVLTGCAGDSALGPLDAAAVRLLESRHRDNLDQVCSRLYDHEPGELSTVYLKVAFPVDRRGVRTEWLWIQAVRWGPDEVEGILVSDPRRRPDLHPGSYVRTAVDRIADYQEVDAGGTVRGNALRQVVDRDPRGE